MLDSNDWFTEIVAPAGSAFSLKIKAKLHEEQTPYQQIAIYDTEHFGRLMVIDGCTMLSTRDNFLYHEMMTHPVLFTHQAPRDLCIIGGGDCGTLCETLKHPDVATVVQIDIDERVTRLAERYFPELTASNQDPRATVLFADGIRWIQQREANSLDVIIIDSTDPVGPAAGLFSVDFYRQCWRALRPGGLFVQQSESPFYHLDIMRNIAHELQAAGFLDPTPIFFPQIIYPSGWWSATMAAKQRGCGDWRAADAAAKPFSTRYYSAAIHQAALVQPPFFSD